MSKILASIIIINYNGQNHIKKCLQSILNNLVDFDYEILVADNASSDSSAQIIKKLAKQHSEIKFFPQIDNAGFGVGCNRMSQHAKGKYLVFLNPDTVASRNWLSAMVGAMEAALDKIGAINGKTYLKNPDTQEERLQNTGLILFSDGYGRDRGAVVSDQHQQNYETDSKYYQQPALTHGVCGVNFIIKKELFDKLGGFDDRFFLYYEDTDLSWRLLRDGYRTAYEPKGEIIHEHAASTGENSPFFIFHVERGRLMLVVKHLSAGQIFWEHLKFGLRAGKMLIKRPKMGWMRLKILCSVLSQWPSLWLSHFQIRFNSLVSRKAIEQIIY